MTKRRLIPMVGVAIAAAVPFAAASGAAGAAATKTVTLRNIAFTPSSVMIHRGGKVRFVWRDGSIGHDVRFRSGGFKASPLQSSGSETLTFKKKGTFHFFCSVHSNMKGTVKVT
jgi:plastocyanin